MIEGGSRHNELKSTTDWSFLSDRTVGENWILVGEAAGFADPILAAGMTLTHTGAREAAYTLLAILDGKTGHDEQWLKDQYDNNQRTRIKQHIRFADFWYASNGQFTDLQNHCQEIAESAGLKLTAAEAFRWLAQGGFTNDVIGQAGIGGLDLAATKQITEQFTGEESEWNINQFNVFRLNIDADTKRVIPRYIDGKIHAVECYERGTNRLALVGMYELLFKVLQKYSDIDQIVKAILSVLKKQLTGSHAKAAFNYAIQALEVMVSEGWVEAELDPAKSRLSVSAPQVGGLIHPHA